MDAKPYRNHQRQVSDSPRAPSERFQTPLLGHRVDRTRHDNDYDREQASHASHHLDVVPGALSPRGQNDQRDSFDRSDLGLRFTEESTLRDGDDDVRLSGRTFSVNGNAGSSVGEVWHIERDNDCNATGAKDDFNPQDSCPARHPIHQPTLSFSTIALCATSIFSTFTSGAYLLIALKGVKWGKRIGLAQGMDPSDAIMITTLFAKAIEMSFGALALITVGQILSRQALQGEPRSGVALAQLSMRDWILQPHTMFTRRRTVKYTFWTALNAFVVLTSLAVTLYTTGAQYMVQPQLRTNDLGRRPIGTVVRSSFGNLRWVQDKCVTLTSEEQDPDYLASTCLAIQMPAQVLIDFQKFMTDWGILRRTGNYSDQSRDRPASTGLIYNDTRVTSTWSNLVNFFADAEGRLISNASLSYPHPAILSAARDPLNNLLQPQSLDGLGSSKIRAGLASPTVNTFCVQMLQGDLDPLVYATWPGAELDPQEWPEPIANVSRDTFRNTTKVDDFFGWSDYDQQVSSGPKLSRPIFPKYPAPFNTVVNNTQYPFWGRDSIYILGQAGGVSESGKNMTGTYVLCEVSVSLESMCVTEYEAALSGGVMTAVCHEDDPDTLHASNTSALRGSATRSRDWFDIGQSWISALGLANGLLGGQEAASRLLMQTVQDLATLNSSFVSMAEMLAVMAGYTAFVSAIDSPVNTDEWNYTANPLTEGQYQYFNASIRSQEYISGGVNSVRGLWLPVLAYVFVANVFMLLHLIWRRGVLVVDFSEPMTLFGLAINSPPSRDMAGACAGGPHGRQWTVKWLLHRTGQHFYMEAERDEDRKATFGESKNPFEETTYELPELRNGGKKERLKQYWNQGGERNFI